MRGSWAQIGRLRGLGAAAWMNLNFAMCAAIGVGAQTAPPPQAKSPVPSLQNLQVISKPAVPVRSPHEPGYVVAKELPDGANAPADEDGNFILGPTHTAAPEMAEDMLQGTVVEFTMNSEDSKMYPGIAREPGTFGTPDPSNPAKLIVTTSHPARLHAQGGVSMFPSSMFRGRRRHSLSARMARIGCCSRRWTI